MIFNKIFSINIKWFKIGFYIFQLQKCKGISSKVLGENKHFIFMDFDNIDYIDLVYELKRIQLKYKLADMLITTDKQKSYRAFCFSKRTFKIYVTILSETKGLCEDFYNWTLTRKKAILRTSEKNGRFYKYDSMLKGYEQTDIPEFLEKEIYETGLTKIRTVRL